MRAITRRAFSPRDQRAVRAGLLVAVPVLAYTLLAKPYTLDVRRKLDALHEQSDLLSREEGIISNRPALRVELPLADASTLRVSSRLYSADTALAATAFGRDVADIVKDEGLVIQRIETRDSVTRWAGLQELAVDVRAQGSFAEILHVLMRLEASSRLTQVMRLAIDRSSTSSDSLALVAFIRGYAR